MKRSIIFALAVILALSAAGCVTSPSPTTTPVPPTATAIPTPPPLATAPENITVTLPPGYPTAVVTITHYINGVISYNGQPSGNYHVLILTDKGNQYGNATDATGKFNVTFPDDGSATYKIQLADAGNSIIYQDKLPRYMNHTGPMNINIEVPGMNVTIT